MRKIVWSTLLAAIPLILAACSSQAPPEPLEMTIDMKEYAFTPADLEFQVGQEVTLHLTNSGALEHEIMFGREVMMMDGMPNAFTVEMFESAGVEPVVSTEKSEDTEHEEDEHAHSGFMVKVPVTHDIYTMSFTVTEDMVGEWEIGCFLLDGVHYNSGMVGALTVEN
jgi:plastocyanin